MKTLDEVKSQISIEILSEEKVDYKIKYRCRKNGEEFVFVFGNELATERFFTDLKKQINYNTLSKPTEKKIVETIKERKSTYLLTDNNFNFISSFTDKTYYPTCKDTKQSFLRDKEKWGVGRRLDNNFLQLMDEDIVIEYSLESNAEFCQKVFLLGEDKFVYVKRNECKMLFPSQLMYLFLKAPNGDLHLHLMFNKSYIY